MASLKACDLVKHYAHEGKVQEILEGVNATFLQGECAAVVGVSGSGKSTLLHLLGGLDLPTSGTVMYDGKNIFELAARERDSFRNQTIGFVFQFHYLLRELTVLENVMLAGLIKKDPAADVRRRAEELLERIGMPTKADAYPHQLSGGQQQRVAVARALINKPAFVLADEPTGNLDAEIARDVTDVLLETTRAWGAGLVICTHDEALYSRADVVWRVSGGRLVRQP